MGDGGARRRHGWSSENGRRALDNSDLGRLAHCQSSVALDTRPWLLILSGAKAVEPLDLNAGRGCQLLGLRHGCG